MLLLNGKKEAVSKRALTVRMISNFVVWVLFKFTNICSPQVSNGVSLTFYTQAQVHDWGSPKSTPRFLWIPQSLLYTLVSSTFRFLLYAVSVPYCIDPNKNKVQPFLQVPNPQSQPKTKQGKTHTSEAFMNVAWRSVGREESFAL